MPLSPDPVPGFVHVMAVWGQAFTDFFLRYSLPSQLSPGNIPALRTNGDSVYVIYTRERDAERLDREPLIIRLREHIDVRFLVVPSSYEAILETGNVHEVLTVFHRHALRLAVDRGNGAVFLAPDAIFSDGTLRLMERHALDGHDAVLTTGIRTVQEDILPWLAERADGSGPATFLPRDMVACALRNLHPTAAATVWGNERFNSAWPSQMFWTDGDDLLLAHCWHLHPLMVRPRPHMEKFDLTIDGDFLEFAMTGSRTAIITDSDEICLIEASRRSYGATAMTELGPFDREQFRHWVARGVQPIHARFVRIPIVFHSGEVDPARIDRLRRQADEVVAHLVHEAGSVLPERSSLPCLHDTNQLRTAGRVFIYGSGEAGRAIRWLMNDAGIHVTGFLDTTRSGETDGLPVRTAVEYAAAQQEGDVIVVVSQYWKSIEQHLRDLGISSAFDGYPLYRKLDWHCPLDFPVEAWGR